MNRNDCLRPRRDGSLKRCRRHCSAHGIDIDECRCRADIANCPGRCYERHRNGKHFIARSDIETMQSQMQRAPSAVQADTMINSAVRCEFRIEICGGWALSKLA